MKTLKRLLGPLVGATGGLDARPSRFAGRLRESDLSTDEFIAIYNSLIFRNGVRKTTEPARNVAIIRRLIDDGWLMLPSSVTVLDLGASAGLDALSTYRCLTEVVKVDSYVLGDLFTEIWIDRSGRNVYDQDGVLIQRRLPFGFVNRFFSAANRYERLAMLPQQFLAAMATVQRRAAPADAERIALVHPDLRAERDAPFSVQRMDVFADLPPDSYDLIICMHLLVPRYFSPAAIEAAHVNLRRATRVGGTVVTGSAEDVKLIRRISDRDYEVRPLRDGAPTMSL
jgi:hypothetical protein